MLLLTIGLILLSLVISHIWWCEARQISLQNFVYDLRDELDSSASRLGCKQDAGYLAWRNRFNAMAGTAKHVSLPVIIYVLTHEWKRANLPSIENEELNRIAEEGISRLAERVHNFMFRETIAGIITWTLISTIMLVYRMQESIKPQVQKWITRWFLADPPDKSAGIGMSGL